MFTKIAFAVAIVLGTVSASFAAPSHSKVTGKVSEPTYFKYATGAEWWKI
jgi:hypothetical protein